MRHLGVTHLARHALEAIRHAQIEGLGLMARAADDVVVVMLARVDLVTIRAIAEVAPPHDAAFLHRREAAVHGHEVATASLHPLMQLLRREGPMLACEDAE